MPVELVCPFVTVAAHIAIMDVLPVNGVDFLLGNNLAGERVFPSPTPSIVDPKETFETSSGVKNRCALVEASLPVCAVKRSMAMKAVEKDVSVPSQVPGAGNSTAGLPEKEFKEKGVTARRVETKSAGMEDDGSHLAGYTIGGAILSPPSPLRFLGLTVVRPGP